ncbi:hypothetical protein Esti_000937 [Eimeria stiedai]
MQVACTPARAQVHMLVSRAGPRAGVLAITKLCKGVTAHGLAVRKVRRETWVRVAFSTFSVSEIWQALLRESGLLGLAGLAQGLLSPLVRAMVHGVHVALKRAGEKRDITEIRFGSLALAKNFFNLQSLSEF